MAEMSEAQARKCGAFLKVLRKTANVTLAAQSPSVGVTRKTLDIWRRRYPDFGTQWDAAIAFAQARLQRGGVVRPYASGRAVLTRGGEYTVRGSRGRSIQVRASKPGLLTVAGERAFLANLAATANIKLSAEAVGIGVSAIYARRRSSPDFERAVLAALADGYDRLEMALLGTAIRSLEPDCALDEWDQADGPLQIAPMTAREAMMVLAQGQTRMGVNGRLDGRVKVARATPEAAEKALLKRLEAYARRRARDGE